MTASGAPSSSGRKPRPTPSSATAIQAAATSPRHCVVSIRSRTNPMSAGSSVTEAIIVVATVIAAATARPAMNGSPISSNPRSETTTVNPAKITARPAVSKAARADASTAPSSARPSR